MVKAIKSRRVRWHGKVYNCLQKFDGTHDEKVLSVHGIILKRILRKLIGRVRTGFNGGTGVAFF
jgi:hypothetical protein